jgi:hypothetical protein
MLFDGKAIFQRLGYAALILASLLLFLYVMNLRSRFYYSGPDYSFLFWLFAWAASAGVGLLLSRKWALLLLFLPGVVFSVVFCMGLANSSGVPSWAVLVNLLFVGVTVATPIVLLRFWTLLWLFGGIGFDSVGHDAQLNDLWKYSGGEWTWMGGSAVANVNGIYGSLGVPAPTNIPGARSAAAVWLDSSGDVWLFGGLGYDGSSAMVGMLSDLWNYSAGQWTWMGGSSVTNQQGIYGTQGVAAASNVPGARFAAYNWIDASGQLWLFGGVAYDSIATSGSMNDLWKYSGGQWTWMGGFKLANQTGIYGIQGTSSANNLPGARQAGLSWTDAAGNGWLFGGNGHYGPSSVGELNDLWKFSNGQWTWVSGSSLGNQSSSYGTEGSLAPGNTPAGRTSSTRWVDGNGNLWLFGGWALTGATSGNLNDLWMYMP